MLKNRHSTAGVYERGFVRRKKEERACFSTAKLQPEKSEKILTRGFEKATAPVVIVKVFFGELSEFKEAKGA
ncbi:hypothetical protein BC343_18145 [Mucilaginibacter pedocola]|uniref:Uncharacterized protein n=1 Tax=Mucilaginibacter pedocola TaxID=1792845 RepID=A0A1S9P7I6_9SPHI|nr:hypothetical protein BC343_18145 [Mucilaginibacter pedocola]